MACCVIVPAKLMRFPRVKADGQGFYHCVSRVVERRFIFHTSGHGSAEAQRFIKLMRRLAAFSGICVLTYALMSNDLSVFIKELKGRFAQWYNQRHDRYGYSGPSDLRVF